jgi:hypothetical protein
LPEGRGQLELTFESPADALERRFATLGFRPAKGVRTHSNQTVMVSLSPGGALRIHRGYAWAPDEVLEAIVRFLSPGVRRAARTQARRTLLGFSVEPYQSPGPARRPRPESPRPGDLTVLTRLADLHQALNIEHFEGRLSSIPLRLSGRMKRRLGEVVMDRESGAATGIVISRRHLRRDGWEEVRATLLHEMVHQWQAESGFPVDHRRGFRGKAREVGIEPRAIRTDAIRRRHCSS